MKYSALEGYGNQYWPVYSSILAWRTPLTEKTGKPQSTGSQRVGHDQSDPACIDTWLCFCFCFACGNSAPMKVDNEGGKAASITGTLVVPSVQGHGLPPPQELWPYQNPFLSLLYWWSEVLFGQSFSVALPIQALRGIPCLGSFSMVWHIRHIEGPPGWDPTL